MTKVLIIEDNPSYSALLTTLLKNAGFITQEEDTCKGGLSYFKENEEDVDLILLDINFYGEPCGLDVLKKIRSMSDIWIGVMTYDKTIDEKKAEGRSVFIRKDSEVVNDLIDDLKVLNKYNHFSRSGRNKTIKTELECNLELIDDNYFSINSDRLWLSPIPYRILHMLYTKPKANKEAGFPSNTYSAKHIQRYLLDKDNDTGNIRIHIKTIRDKINDITDGCGTKIIVNDPGFGYRCTCSPSPNKNP